MKNKNIKLALRNGWNKLIGKKPLITEYYDIVLAISAHSDSLAGTSEQKAVLKALNDLTEAYTINTRYGVSLGDNFNPFAVTTLPKAIKEKITVGRAIMNQYGIRAKQCVR